MLPRLRTLYQFGEVRAVIYLGDADHIAQLLLVGPWST